MKKVSFSILLLLFGIVFTGIIFTGRVAIPYISNKASTPVIVQHKVVYTETNDNETVIWMASPPDLTDKIALTRVKHASGYPIKASVSPDGTKIAYTILPFGSRQPFTNGKLFLMDIKGEKQKELDDNINYYMIPRWSSDNSSIVYIKTIPLSQEKDRTELYSIDLNGTKKLSLADEESLEIYPIGYSPNGKQFYYDRIIPEGDELWVIDLVFNSNRFISKISIGMAWNLSLSSDGKEILGSIIENRSPASYAVISISIDGEKRYTWANGSQRHYTPIWGPNINDITTNIPNGDYSENYQGTLKILNRMSNNEIQLSSSNKWMDVPSSWSPDKHWLIIERYNNFGSEMSLMDYEGNIQQTNFPFDRVTFIGWTQNSLK